MPRAFDPEREGATLRLPLATRRQIAALMMDLDQDATSVVVIAVRALYDREIGPAADRDVLAELDELRARLDALERPQ